MWYGHHEQIISAAHRGELFSSEARSIYVVPYRADKKTGEAKQKLDKMLAMKVIEPAQTGWASPIVFDQKKDGTLRACADFCKLNEVATCHSYPLPRVDEGIDSLGHARIWFTPDANSD